MTPRGDTGRATSSRSQAGQPSMLGFSEPSYGSSRLVLSTSPCHNCGDNRIAVSKLLASHLLEVHGGVMVSQGHRPLWIERDVGGRYTYNLIGRLKSV